MTMHGGDIFEISRERGWDWHEVADFSANINPLGPAPGVEPAVRAALDRIRHYPESEPVRLVRALARLWKVLNLQAYRKARILLYGTSLLMVILDAGVMR